MLTNAMLVLTDLSTEGAGEMTVLVEGDVERTYPGAEATRSFGPWRAIAAVWGRVARLIPGEGGQTLIDQAQDLVDEKDNQWRVMEALAGAFGKEREGR